MKNKYLMPFFLKQFEKKISKKWLNYVINDLMEPGLWTHYFLWEAYQVLKLFGDDLEGVKILEPGSGNGIIASLLSLMKAKVTLLDYSLEALNKAKRHARMLNAQNIEYVQGDLFNMPFRKKFDFVWNDGVIEHFEKPDEVVKQMIKFTKPGGKVLVTVPAKYTLHTMIIRPYARRKKLYSCDKWGKEKSFSERKLKQILQKSGLVDIRVTTNNLRRAFLDDIFFLPILTNGPRRRRIGIPLGKALFYFIDILETYVPFLHKAGFITAAIGTVNNRVQN